MLFAEEHNTQQTLKMSDLEEQENELMALSSIYDEDVFSRSSDTGVSGGELSVCLDLPSPMLVTYKQLGGSEDGESSSFTVDYLSPLKLHFVLPKDYPSVSPPQYTLSCKWLTRSFQTNVCQKLDQIWNENKGSVILFLWMQFLKDDVLDLLEISNSLDLMKYSINLKASTTDEDDNIDCVRNVSLSSLSEEKSPSHSGRYVRGRTHGAIGVNKPITRRKKDLQPDLRTVQDVCSFTSVIRALKDYNRSQGWKVYSTSYFSCRVCFSDKLGVQCIQFEDCKHIFCKECMKRYFETQIKEGNVKSLTCPEVKCTTQALPLQVKELVDNDVYERYDALLLQSLLSTMADVVYCPRKFCQCPCIKEDDQPMATCSACGYVFCVKCSMVYHGVAPCTFKREERKKLCEEYLSGSKEVKKQLEQRFGEKQIKLLVENIQSEGWLDSNSKKCPNCSADIEKSDGCNKMTCWRCSTYFCWLCLCKLNKADPYKHYNSAGSPCADKLFEGVHADFFDDEFGEQEEVDEDWHFAQFL